MSLVNYKNRFVLYGKGKAITILLGYNTPNIDFSQLKFESKFSGQLLNTNFAISKIDHAKMFSIEFFAVNDVFSDVLLISLDDGSMNIPVSIDLVKHESEPFHNI